MRFAGSLATLALLLPLAGCGGDSTSPNPIAHPEGLWTVSGIPSAIVHLAPDQLATSGNRAPTTEVTTPSAKLSEPGGIAFDTDGTMWIASSFDSVLVAFSPASVATSGTVAARTVIKAVNGSLRLPTGIAFDRNHRLWVANTGNGTIVRFDRDQLASSGAPAPTVVLAGQTHPAGLAFDAEGSLWVSYPLTSTLVKYTGDQLEASGAPAPAVILTATDRSLDGPEYIAFDATGNLWVPNVGNFTIVSFTPAQLAVSGSPVPQVVLSANSSLALPISLAFAADGSLWVMNGEGQLEQFAVGSLAASGAPAPTVRVALASHTLLLNEAFWPVPAGLPLN